MTFGLTVTATHRAGAEANFCHFSTARTRSFDVNATFTLLERHGWDIHAV
jgi:hypothetical protein